MGADADVGVLPSVQREALGTGAREPPGGLPWSVRPAADVGLAVRGASRPVAYSGYNGSFRYPSSGRFGDIMEALAESVSHAIRNSERVATIDLARREVCTESGRTFGYERLISTIPLDHLVARAGLGTTRDGLFAATEILNVRVGVRGVSRTSLHWIYVPDPGMPFHRIGFPGNVSATTCRAGCASLSIEYTAPAVGPRVVSHAIASAALDYVSRHGLMEVEEVLVTDEYTISPAYVVERAPGRPEFAELERHLASQGVRLAGRFGSWDYMSIEDAYVSGRRAAVAPPPPSRRGRAAAAHGRRPG